jgi:hypothetical protein
VPDDEAVGERSVIMGAMRAHGMEPRTSADEKDVVFAGFTEEHTAVFKRTRVDTFGQVRCRFLVFRHAVLPRGKRFAASVARSAAFLESIAPIPQ